MIYERIISGIFGYTIFIAVVALLAGDSGITWIFWKRVFTFGGMLLLIVGGISVALGLISFAIWGIPK